MTEEDVRGRWRLLLAEVARRENRLQEQRAEDILYHGEWKADEVIEIPNNVMPDEDEVNNVNQND